MEVIIKCSDDCRGGTNVYGEPIIEVVRCRECKYWHKNIKVGDGIPIADMCYDFQADDYCSYGERKESE